MTTESTPPDRVNEESLAEFRKLFLSPDALLGFLERFVKTLVRLGIGVGKSRAIDDLLTHHETFRRFDLVIYAAPAWNIIHERAIVRGCLLYTSPSPRD